jgi:hypothetical protein
MRQLRINIWQYSLSLEIEAGTQAADFDAIVLDNTVPNNFHATSVAEVQNIHYLTQEIAQNFQVTP